MEDTRARRLRGPALLAALYSTVYLAVLVLESGSPAAIVVDDLGNLLSPVVAAVACAFAARRTTSRLRRSWLLLACFAGTWALGQLAWCWYELVLEVPVPFPGLPDLGYLASAPFVVAALLVHPDAPRLTTGRLRLAADALVVGVSLLALTYRFVLREAYESVGASGLGHALGLAYPLIDVVVVTLLVIVAARTRRGRGNHSFAFVAACLAAGALGHMVYGVLAQNGSWVPGNPVDAAWGVGFLMLALGAHVQAGGPAVEQPDRAAPFYSALLLYLPVLALFGVVIVDQAAGRYADVPGRLMGAMVFAGLLSRQLLALLENSRLNRGLEATVAERTRELTASAEQLQRQAWCDPLTGLPNRARLFDRIDNALLDGPVVVALLDLDGFKSVNDSLGHSAGDRLLEMIGARLVSDLRPGVIAARLGGDEFAFLLPGCDSEAEACAFGAEVLRTLAEPVTLDSRSLALTGSLGLALSDGADTSHSLLRNADVAMYAAKAEGKDRLRMFVPAMHDELLAQLALEADLRSALLAGEVVPWFQPVVDLRTGRMTGVEALARWPKDGALVSPEVFVPLAERTGLITILGRQILRAACARAAVWNREAPLTLAVNLSAVQLGSDDLVDEVREALADSGLPPQALVLEITETVLMEDASSVGPRLAALRALGVRIALDDFGTGYSALGYLQKIPVDIVKIDRAFVREVHLGARQGALAAAVMTLATSLDLEVIAEGIELPEQAERLLALGCQLAQGFLFNPALPPEEVTRVWRAARQETAYKSAVL